MLYKNDLNINLPNSDSGLVIKSGYFDSAKTEYAFVEYTLFPKQAATLGNAFTGFDSVAVYAKINDCTYTLINRKEMPPLTKLDSVFNNSIRLKTFVYSSSDPTCCPSKYTYKSYSLDNMCSSNFILK